MRACICNVPIRGRPTRVPPFGPMYITQAIKSIGWDVEFFNIDYKRPTDEQVKEYFKREQFDLLGISAVVATGYGYTKFLAKVIKEVSPHTIIVVGGNLAASSEIVLKNDEIDFCVIGDGELTIQEIINRLPKNDLGKLVRPSTWDGTALSEVKGVCYRGVDGKVVFTGYRPLLAIENVMWPDYSLLEKDGSTDHYFEDATAWFQGYGIPVPEGMKDKKCAWIPIAKGCINRCTFCHRFERGYRMRPKDQILEHIDELKKQYNVGVILMFDESFGAIPSKTNDFVEALRDSGLYWGSGSVRTKSINDEIVKHWYDCGCRMIICGIESGSPTMLNVMEKNCTLDDNVRALKAIHAAGVATSIMMVLGMPGETDKTIRESTQFLKDMLPYYHIEGRGDLLEEISCFYAQALPNTPLYEYYREHGFIGKSITEEEEYLYKISNIDAQDISHYINATRQPLLSTLLWRDMLFWGVYEHYLKTFHKIEFSLGLVLHEVIARLKRKFGSNKDEWTPLEKKCKQKIRIPAIYLMMYHPATFFIAYPANVLKVAIRYTKDPLKLCYHLATLSWWLILGRPEHKLTPKLSLRKIVNVIPAEDGSDSTIPLRKGR